MSRSLQSASVASHSRGAIFAGRSVARLAFVCATPLFVLVGCGEAPSSLLATHGISLKPINEVIVYGGSNGQIAMVGDTVRVDAEGFRDGQGLGTESPRTVLFSTSDSSVVRLETTIWTLSFIPTTRVRGLREGLVTIFATINGVTGRDSLRVIPPIRIIQLTPNPATVRVNDTISIGVRVIAQNGADITTVAPFVSMDANGTALYAGKNTFRGVKAGTTTLRAQVGSVTATEILTIVP